MPTIENRLVLHYYSIEKAGQNNAEFKQTENKFFDTNTSHRALMYFNGDQSGCPSHANV